MRITELSARDRRAIAAGLGMLAAIWLFSRGIPGAWRRHDALVILTAETTRQLGRARALVALEPVLRQEFASSAARLNALAPRLVAGRSRAEAAATLSSLIGGMAQRINLRVNRLEPLPDSAAGPFTRVAVRIEVLGDIRVLARWLATIEESQPTLAVLELGIVAPEATQTSERPEVLRANLVIAAWSALGGDAQ